MSGSKPMRPCPCLLQLACLIFALTLWLTPSWAATRTPEAQAPEAVPAQVMPLPETPDQTDAPVESALSEATTTETAPETTTEAATETATAPSQDSATAGETTPQLEVQDSASTPVENASSETSPSATPDQTDAPVETALSEVTATETATETTTEAATETATAPSQDDPTQDTAQAAMSAKPLTPGLLLPEQNLSIELPPNLPGEAPKEGPALPDMPSFPEVQSQPMAATQPSPGQSLPELRFEPQRFPTLEHPEEAKAEPPEPPAPAVEAAPEPPPQPVTVKLKRAKKKRHICPPCPACPTCPVCPEPPKDETLTLDLILFGKIQGDFAFIDCRDATGQSDQFAYASQVALFHTLSDLARRQALLDPVAFNLGDSTFPGAFANFLFSQGEAGATELATLLSKIPYEGLTLGNHDFSPPRDESRRFFEAARRARLPFLGANLRCATDDTAANLCALLGTNDGDRPWRLIQRGPLTIGVTALIDPAIASQLAKDRLEGLEILDPKPVLRDLVPKMRAQGADLVIVLFHLSSGQTTSGLEPLIDGIEGLDLVITDRLFAIDEEPLTADIPALRQMGHMVLPRTHTFVLGTGSSAHSATRATLRIGKVSKDDKSGKTTSDSARYRIEQINPRYISTGILDPDPGTTHRLESAAEAFCESWGSPLKPGSELTQAFDIFDMAEFILNTLRFTAGTELAFMNARAFRNPEQFPLLDTLTQADIFSTLPFGSQLITADIPGAQLEKLATHLGGEILGVGLTRDAKGALTVNGRPLDKGRIYSVALNEFLAEGSGGFLNPKKLRNAAPYIDPATNKAPTLAWLVSDAVRRGQFDTPDGASRLSPKESFPDLHRRPLWTFGGSLNAAYSHMDIVNPTTADGEAAYDKSRLTAVATDLLNIELKALANAQSRDHGWDSDFLLQYATTRLKGEGESNVFEETKDVLRLRSAYKYFGLSSALGSRWYVPVPYSEVQLESQLTKSEDSAWHPWELTGIVGLLLKLTPKLELKMGFNIRSDLNAPQESPMVGLFVGYQLVKTNLIEIAKRPIQFESELEYFFNADGSDRLHEFRWANKLFFSITGHLALTANFNMYIYRTKEVGELGRALEGMVGLNVAIEKMLQTF